MNSIVRGRGERVRSSFLKRGEKLCEQARDTVTPFRISSHVRPSRPFATREKGLSIIHQFITFCVNFNFFQESNANNNNHFQLPLSPNHHLSFHHHQHHPHLRKVGLAYTPVTHVTSQTKFVFEVVQLSSTFKSFNWCIYPCYYNRSSSSTTSIFFCLFPLLIQGSI